MAAVSVNVKWGREKYTLDVDPSEPPEVLRAQLFGLTQVLPERQKLMFKGKAIQDEWPKSVKFKAGITFLLMGTAEEGIAASTEKIVFEEDLKDSEKIAASALPPGLPNLGNTCYLNASLQCMHKVPELSSALTSYAQSQPGRSADPSVELVRAISLVFQMMDRADNSAMLHAAVENMVGRLRTVNPQFGESGPHGYSQQDAAEAWGVIMTAMQNLVPPAGSASPPAPTQSVVDRLFGFGMRETLTCVDNPDEPPSVKSKRELALSCAITKEVGFMASGIRVSLSGNLTKRSETLDRDAVYTKKVELDRLPGYAVVQFVRFFYKERTQEQCKILKDVKFPEELDLIEFCTPELVKKLKPMRDAFEEHRNAEIEAEVSFKKGSDGGAAAEGGAAGAAAAQEYMPWSFPDDPGSNNSGRYELAAVLTHKGRSTSSGHYVGWGKVEGEGNWAVFDDDTVTPVKSKDVLQLSGELGADWHSAYLLVYAPKRLPKGDFASLKGASSMKVEGGAAAAPDAAAAAAAPMEE